MPDLPAPARYFPPRTGRYEVSASLRPLETDFGNGPADRLAFQLDTRFPEFRANKLRCRAERLSKYCGQQNLPPPVRAAAVAFLVRQLCLEHPAHFRWHPAGALYCALTRETLHLDSHHHLTHVEGPAPQPPYAHALDALCSQVQEDVALVCTRDHGLDWLAAYHVCAPSGWTPEEKLGHDFIEIHRPVPGIQRLNRAAASLVHGMVHRPPTVRFVWGLETDARLNLHPEPPPHVAPPPAFQPEAASPFVVRVERQVMWGLPEVGAALFLIRLSHLPAAHLRPEERAQLLAALRGMSPAARAYKGFESYLPPLLAWLQSP